jgi:aryl-alcohol dehydrogenase-like predicted oxidoreductase
LQSDIGLGLAALGRPAYINLGREGALPAERTVGAMRAASWDVLDAAYAAGVRWIDVARSYGRAEEFLAGWLVDRAVPEDGLTISSKWGYAYVGDWRMDAEVHEVKEHTFARFTQQWGESRALLGDRIALYQVHSLTTDSPLFTDRPLLEALAGSSADGVRVGFSTSGPAQAEAVERGLALQVDGQRVFTAVHSTWNVLEPSVGPALAAAHDEGAHVLVKETLANGRLAAEAPALLAEIAEKHSVTADALAIAAVLDQPWADTVLVGPASTDQLTSNLQAAAVRLTDHDRDGLSQLAEHAKDYWSQRSALAWD